MLPTISSLLKNHSTLSGVRRHLVAIAELAFEDLHRQRVLEIFLDRTLERTRAVHGIVTVLCEIMLRLRGQGERDFPFQEEFLEMSDLDVNDSLDALLGQT